MRIRMLKTIKIEDLRIDGGTQQRPIDEATVAKYKTMMTEGDKFPPMEVVYDGLDNWLWDGFHRFFAMMQMNLKETEVTITKGLQKDAVFFSYGANKIHGMPRGVGVAGEIVKKMLQNTDYSTMSFRQIAKHVGVTHPYVSKLAKGIRDDHEEIGACGNQLPDRNADSNSETKVERSETLKVTRGDQTYEMKNTAKESEKLYDMTGEIVPDNIKEIFIRADEFKSMIADYNKHLRIIKKAKEDGDVLYKHLSFDSVIAMINDAKRAIRFSMPYAVCPYCFNDANNKKCLPCKGSGWVPEAIWKNIPQDIRGKR